MRSLHFSKHSPETEAGLTRRQFVTGIGAGLSAAAGLMGLGYPALAATNPIAMQPKVLAGDQLSLNIGYQKVNFTGKERIATTINGSLPAPTLRWKEGDRVRIKVSNQLAHDSSIHWHGLILPTEMDGVPGFSFDGIKPGQSFDYEFPLLQNGTYWYHSHSGYQEQTGMYGAIIIDPKDNDPVAYDRDYVVQLSDWSDEAPEKVFAKLKKKSHYYNFQERTAVDLLRDIRDKGVAKTFQDRAMWNQMRMSDRDIADVTGYTYTFLMNGITPEPGWAGLFKRGEKIRLRFINAAAMTIFDIRIPGLKMTVVASDGQYVEPVTVDELRIGVAETYDVIVGPSDNQAYTVFAQTIDRSGYARGTLTPDLSLKADVPDMDPTPVLGHRDMGMGTHAHHMHGMHDQHAMHNANTNIMTNTEAMDHSAHSKHQHHHQTITPAGIVSNPKIIHLPSEFGPQVDMRAEAPVNGLNDPGIGLRDHMRLYGRKVLTYADLHNLYSTVDKRDPEREIQLHLTGNMSRYMWSMNGIPFADAEPLILKYGERVRIVLVNDTMMTHPIHLHGMWSELETGVPEKIPRKHTVIVQPGSTISYLVTADAIGRWAYHCHLMYHMMGMFREVRVVKA